MEVAAGVRRLENLTAPPTDLIGAGDLLEIAVYEAGVTLFGGNGNRVSGVSAGSSFDPSVQVERLPPMRVPDNGQIRIPYVGQVRAAGRTVRELQDAIREGLRPMSQFPQVVVTIREGVFNALVLSGEVARPGRVNLQTNGETIADAVALAGGYRGEAKDLAVTVQRSGIEESFRLEDLLDGRNRDLRAYPGDRITVVRAPRSFSVLGAAGRVDQVGFRTSRMNVAEAVAAAGGVNPDLGDAGAVFVLRYERNAAGQVEPVVYHFNMMTTNAYFLSQRMTMQDKDVLYIGNARSNQPRKLVQIISQLFSPILAVAGTVQAVTN